MKKWALVWPCALAWIACEPAAVPPLASFQAAAKCGSATCDDGLPCTIDTCDAADGCSHVASEDKPCADAEPCLVQPTCQQGKCKGPEGLWRTAAGVSKTTDDWLTHACADPDGGLVAVGFVLQPEILNLQQTENVLIHFGADGQILTQTVMTGKQHHDRLNGVARLPDGRYLGVGFEASLVTPIDPTETSNIEWVVLQDSGAAQSHVRKTASFRRLDAVAVAQDGSPLAVGRSDDKGLAVRLFKDVQDVQWTEELAPPESQGLLLDVAAVRDVPVGWVAVGLAAQNGKSLAWLQRIGASPGAGQPLCTVAPPGMQAMLTRVVALPDGGVLALGHAGQGSVPGPENLMSAYLVRTDASLNLLWQRVGDLGFQADSLALLADDRTLILGGAARPPQGMRNALQRWDIDGRAGPWRTDLQTPPAAIVALPGHRLGVVSNGSFASQIDSFAQRLDPWGAATCASSGVCAATVSCADLDPCTLDACDAKTGCSHTPVQDGGQCGDGRSGPKVCKGGSCQ